MMLGSFPKAILHIDGDSFFASVEQALDPKLKGKAVITGKERGIASAMSYEAKARGVTRGMSLLEIKKICPETIILPSDYETYSLFSSRMYAIVRRFTPSVDEYSIDECFADLTGMRRPLHMSYPQIAENIKTDLERELNMTFSLGLGPNKVISKVASKWNKPNGLTIIPTRDIEKYLAALPLDKIWGIGPQTTAHLSKYGIKTALDFAKKDEAWVKKITAKPYYEIWQELNGNFVYDLNLEEKHDYQSISKTKTFTPPSSDPEFIFSQLSKNVENACIKARRHKLVAGGLLFFLKTQDYRYSGLEVKLSQALAIPEEMLKVIRPYFDTIFSPTKLYRATGVVLTKLAENNASQLDLFGERLKIEEVLKVYEGIDELDKKYGKHTVFLGSSLKAMTRDAHLGGRGYVAKRKSNLFRGETHRQRLHIPMLGEVK